MYMFFANIKELITFRNFKVDLNSIDSIEYLLEREKKDTKTDQSPAGYWVLGNQLSPSEGRFCPGTCCLGTRDCQHS